MEDKISTGQLIEIVEKSDLDPVIKDILIRDINKEGVSDFLLEQVIAYCDSAINLLEKKRQAIKTN